MCVSMSVLESIKYILEQLNNHNPFDFDEYEDFEENQKEEIQKKLLKVGLKISNIYRKMWD